MRIYLFTLLTSIAYIITTRQEKQAPPAQSQAVRAEQVKTHLPEQRERQAQEQLIQAHLPEQRERQAQFQSVQARLPDLRDIQAQSQSVQAHLPEQRERQDQSQEVQAEAGPGEITPTNIISPSCKIAGCFKELCIHETESFNRTCNYRFRDEFNCYKNSNCLLVENGTCEWERTTTVEKCLRNARRTRRREPLTCITTGCNNEICIDERLAPMNTSCTYKPEYECLRYTSCLRRGNRCAFERNRDFLSCLFHARRTPGREESYDEEDDVELY
jgi:hypothetical protein